MVLLKCFFANFGMRLDGLFLRDMKASGIWNDTELHKTVFDEKTKQLDELQALIDRKYLQFCDPSVPLHLFARLMGDASILALRLVAPYPRRYPQGLIKMPFNERDEVFWISMDVLGFYNIAQRTKAFGDFYGMLTYSVSAQLPSPAFIEKLQTQAAITSDMSADETPIDCSERDLIQYFELQNASFAQT